MLPPANELAVLATRLVAARAPLARCEAKPADRRRPSASEPLLQVLRTQVSSGTGPIPLDRDG